MMPEYLQNRIKKWDVISQKQESQLTEKNISITLPDGKQIPGIAGKTTPMEIAKSISTGLAQRMVAAKVNGKVQDLGLPFAEDATLELLDFSHPDGEHVFWHSSAHVLGQAIELEFPNAKLCIGPPVETGGFYYDVFLGDRVITKDDYKKLEKFITSIQKEKQEFKRLVLTKKEALDMFHDNPFKIEIINNKVPDGETCTAYRCGPLIDLCKGPHVPNTSYIKAMTVTSNSSAYWLGKVENPSLQRVYGISFPNKKKMKEHKKWVEEMAKREHKKVGEEQQKLFFFHPLSPGSCFFLPHGTRIYNALKQFIRSEYRNRGYQEVLSPTVFHTDLWRTSGHWENYKDNMFSFRCENQEFGVKPMNCPGHCLMFKREGDVRSYRDLPIRFADFGVLHRNELSGALSGLTRVRRFQQDDAHIFCRRDQLKSEIMGVLDMLQTVYDVFGFQFNLELSTRPAKYMGDLELWDQAEVILAECLNEFGQEWSLNPADGAFYGPKIDIELLDTFKRKFQCATIQVDFQLPIKFDLNFTRSDKKLERPVIIHRAILGSVERCMAILIEHYGGYWPFWLSPRQVLIVTITNDWDAYARKVCSRLHNEGFFVSFDDGGSSEEEKKQKKRHKTVDFKIQQAFKEKERYNYILIIGRKESEEEKVTMRRRGTAKWEQAQVTIPELLTFFHTLKKERSLEDQDYKLYKTLPAAPKPPPRKPRENQTNKNKKGKQGSKKGKQGSKKGKQGSKKGKQDSKKGKQGSKKN